MKRLTLLSTIAGTWLIAGTTAHAQETARPAAQPQLGGIEVGASIAVAIRLLGMPAEVASLDTGHTWTWRSPHAELRATTDDDAIVRTVTLRPLDDANTIAVSVDGKSVRVGLFGYTRAQAQAQLSPIADVASRTTSLYTTGFNRQLALTFDDKGTLTQAAYGDRGFLSHLGLLSVESDLLKNQYYAAPQLRGGPAASTGAHETVVRYKIAIDGKLESVQVAVSSNDAAADAKALQLAKLGKWTPARYNSVAIPSVAFRMIGT